ncbi:hypothetical protein D1BOALGB6SA_1098 [Olavius sp. associated proteobacterium Delta 1]|nr:hypothetical protein D1BOALGB6SA_1098 [Olavius sp. associated proteobacterium Delta 1]
MYTLEVSAIMIGLICKRYIDHITTETLLLREKADPNMWWLTFFH